MCDHLVKQMHKEYCGYSAAAYGLTDSGRLWHITSNEDLINGHGLTRSKYDHTLYYSKNNNDVLYLVLAVKVKDYLNGGSLEKMHSFEDFLEDI